MMDEEVEKSPEDGPVVEENKADLEEREEESPPSVTKDDSDQSDLSTKSTENLENVEKSSERTDGQNDLAERDDNEVQSNAGENDAERCVTGAKKRSIDEASPEDEEVEVKEKRCKTDSEEGSDTENQLLGEVEDKPESMTASTEDLLLQDGTEDTQKEDTTTPNSPKPVTEESPGETDEGTKAPAASDGAEASKEIDSEMETDAAIETDAAVETNAATETNAVNTEEKSEEATTLKPGEPVNGKMDDDDDSTVKSDDSEKENINADMPMDLSTKSSATSDIITLSDESEDEGRMNGFYKSISEEMTPEQKRARRKLVKKLQAELRNEEAKLVLLKKMRQSQATQQLQDHSNFNSSNKQAPMKAHAGQPPPLIRGGQSGGSSSKSQNQSMSSQAIRGQQLAHMRAQMQGPPPLVMAPSMGHMMQPQGLRGGLPPGAAPNIMPGFRGQLHQQAQVHSQQMAQHQQQQPVAETQTPAQRQAAAKLALRKQLEKTLLQIPPPKPPPPEMNFIPSLISNEFIMLVGLEEVVNYITDADLIARGEKSPDEKLVCTPFTCIQCDTDFTPVWKREKPGSKNVICEMCVTTNQKKALKQEHTNRLKSAFVKALQQEQEIERMQSQAGSSNTPTTTTATTTVVPAQHAPSPVTTSVNMTAPSYKSSAHAAAVEQLRHHQNFIQAHHAHQAHLRASQQSLGLPTFNPRTPFPYQIRHDLQRQYLLDMIPSRSMAQSNIGWKS